MRAASGYHSSRLRGGHDDRQKREVVAAKDALLSRDGGATA